MIWADNLKALYNIKSCFVLEGNVHDLYIYKNSIYRLDAVIEAMLKEQLDADFIVFTPDRKPEGEPELLSGCKGHNDLDIADSICSFMEKSHNKPSVCILKNGGRIESPDMFYRRLLCACSEAKRSGAYLNTLIILCEKASELPNWFFTGKVKTISVPLPDREERRNFAEGFMNVREEMDAFLSLTEGLNLVDIDAIRRLCLTNGFKDLESAINMYRHGIRKNPWSEFRELLLSGKAAETIKKNLIGQNEAVDEMVQRLKTATSGLDLRGHSGQPPRGCVFLLGPTGVGKTQLIRAFSEMLGKDSLIRINCADFRHESDIYRLIGAPPSYIGYDPEGGVLTRNVKKKRFCIILFDEAEKADKSLFRILLSVLDDGILTTPSGETVSFQESFIVFTSNLGIEKEEYDAFGQVTRRVPVVSPEMSREEMLEKIYPQIKAFFPPEFIGRVGRHNFIAFSFMTAKSGAEILENRLEYIKSKLRDENGIELRISPETVKLLKEKLSAPEVLQYGGRAIEDEIKNLFTDPLILKLEQGNYRKINAEVKNNKIIFREAFL